MTERTPPPVPKTAALIDKIRCDHDRGRDELNLNNICLWDSQPWPCNLIRLVDALDAAQRRADASARHAEQAQAELDRLAAQRDAVLALHEVTVLCWTHTNTGNCCPDDPRRQHYCPVCGPTGSQECATRRALDTTQNGGDQ